MVKREKRTTNRSNYEVQVTIEVNNQNFVGKSKDISAGGMFIICDEYPGIGEKAMITFDLPSIPKTNMGAFIRWYNKLGFGVQFAPIGARQTHEINRICSKRT